MNTTTKTKTRIVAGAVSASSAVALILAGTGVAFAKPANSGDSATMTAAPSDQDNQNAPQQQNYYGVLPSAMFFQTLDTPTESGGGESTTTTTDSADRKVSLARDTMGSGISQAEDAYRSWVEDSTEYTLETANNLLKSSPDSGKALVLKTLETLQLPTTGEGDSEGGWLDNLKRKMKEKDGVDVKSATEAITKAWDDGDEKAKRAIYVKALEARGVAQNAVVQTAIKTNEDLMKVTRWSTKNKEISQDLEKKIKAAQEAMGKVATGTRAVDELPESGNNTQGAKKVKFSKAATEIEKEAVDSVKDVQKVLDQLAEDN